MVARQILQNPLGLILFGQGLPLNSSNDDKAIKSIGFGQAAGINPPKIKADDRKLLESQKKVFSSTFSLELHKLPPISNQTQENPIDTQARLLADNFESQVMELKVLEAELKKLSTDPVEIQEGMLTFVEGLGFRFLQLATTGNPDDPQFEDIQKKLKGLAAKTYLMLARVADGSVVEEIKIKAPYYEGLGKLALENIEGAKFEFEKVRKKVPEAKEKLEIMERDRLRKNNLVGLQTWSLYVEEGNWVLAEKSRSVLGSFHWVFDYLIRGDGKSIEDDRAVRKATEKRLITKVRNLILSGKMDTLYTALHYLALNSQDSKIKARALELFRDAQSGDVPIKGSSDFIPRLIEFTASKNLDVALASRLFDKAHRLEIENIDFGPQCSLGVYTIIHETTQDPQLKKITRFQLDKGQMEKGFKDYLFSFLKTTDPESLALEVTLMAGAAYVGGRVGLAALDKLRKSGTVGWKGLVVAKGAEIGAEGSTLWALNTTKDVLLHDPSKILDPKLLAKSYGATVIMIGYLKGFGAVGQSHGPRVARWLGLTKKGTPRLSAAGRTLAWAGGHSAGMAGMVASTHTSELLNLQESPLGGWKESLVHDIFGYVRFAVAHRLVDGTAGGRLTKFSHQNVHEKVLKTAQVKVEGELPKLGHVITGRKTNGQPIFKDHRTQKLYEQLTHATLTRPGFSPAKLARFLQKGAMEKARNYAREYHLGLRIKNHRLTDAYHRPNEFNQALGKAVGFRNLIPAPLAGTLVGLGQFLSTKAAIGAVPDSSGGIAGESLATLTLGAGVLAMAASKKSSRKSKKEHPQKIKRTPEQEAAWQDVLKAEKRWKDPNNQVVHDATNNLRVINFYLEPKYQRIPRVDNAINDIRVIFRYLNPKDLRPLVKKLERFLGSWNFEPQRRIRVLLREIAGLLKEGGPPHWFVDILNNLDFRRDPDELFRSLSSINFGFPRLKKKNSYPAKWPQWQRQIVKQLGYYPINNLSPTTAPLERVIPVHYLYLSDESRQLASSLPDKMNMMREVMALTLIREGWKPGSRPSKPLLELILSDGDGKLPFLSAKNSNGNSLLINGHHRIAALISLVADGYLPRDTLKKIPFLRTPDIKIEKLISDTFGPKDVATLPSFNWSKVMKLHPKSVELLRVTGGTAERMRRYKKSLQNRGGGA